MRFGVMVASGLAMLAFATGVAAAQTQGETILGVWRCTSQTPDGIVAGQMTYKADGTTDSALTFSSDTDGMKLVAELDAKSSWKLLDGGMMREQILGITARSARVNGEDLPSSVLTEIAGSISHEAADSTIELSPVNMVLVDPEGTRTVCIR